MFKEWLKDSFRVQIWTRLSPKASNNKKKSFETKTPHSEQWAGSGCDEGSGCLLSGRVAVLHIIKDKGKNTNTNKQTHKYK